MQHYQELAEYFTEIEALESAMGLMHWDRATYMPEKSGSYRGVRMSLLSKLHHEMCTHPKIADLISKINLNSLDEWQQANVHEIEHEYHQSTMFDAHLIEKLSNTSNECELIWRKAKQEDNFDAVIPKLDELIILTKEQAQIKADKSSINNYEALVDFYDRGQKLDNINKLFDQVLAFLPDFIEQVIDKQNSLNIKQQHIELAIDKQHQICMQIAKDLGFDFDYGRLDKTFHPFCGGSYGDIRITNTYDEHNALNAIMATVHETGHALYEQNLPKNYYNQRVGKALGMSMHESQSLTYEMQLGSSKAFVNYLSQLLKDIGGIDISFQELWHNINFVKRSYIRILADEVTYPLHVILRFKLEQQIFAGNLKTKDIPILWNELMQKYLQITPPSNALGCLQDVHWYSGAFGYFPSYLSGAIIAAQLFTKAKQTLDKDRLNKFDFSGVKNWYKTNIHNFGRKMPMNELILQASNKELSIEDYKNYLQNKYLYR
ncbi:carboxypeptidase M32 [Rickettsiales endosymbiont of Stachyamoeba lipophora]|uniref:carboxypeptidase M32 n=1 Tax=Rickettsiales endosymbiont of Stachyamoeba lipophora TaxID=2486578 RepID=UPI000F64EF2B|nr:carboxypeptidase M32 [Rickettsiales endosymbiont of Stachyamoeba lipophora]AZL15952.1 carboxypeptidase M32 [Rickettsiales endosymbiont of Stachyamoeba lipophora]